MGSRVAGLRYFEVRSLQAVQNCTQGVTGVGVNSGLSGESGDRLVTLQTVHTDCTPVQANNFCTGAVDWARVGGVVQEGWGVCKTDVNRWEPKYVPDWDELPVSRHPRF